MITSTLKEFIARVPKAELHNHLEGGALYPEVALKLAERNGISLPFEDLESAKRYYDFTSLNQFLDTLRMVVGTLNTAEDYETITVKHGEVAAQQNIRYHELFFTHGLVSRRGIPFEAIVEGIAAGRKINKERYGVETWFIADIDRTLEPEEGVKLVEMAHANREKAGILGIGMDCQEIGYPASRHKPGYDRAAERDFRRVGHAGEDCGPEYVWDVITLLGVERIDHGVRSIDDDKLVAYLAETQIPLTVCPFANIELKIYPDMASHPIKRLMDAGVFVTVNSDDPPMFKGVLVDNFISVADTFDLTVDDVKKLARNSFEATFMDDETKADYLRQFDAEVSQLQAELFD